MESKKERFRRAFAWTGLTSNGLAVKLGMASRTIYNYTNKDIEPTDECLRKMSKTFPELNEEWLLDGEGDMMLNQRQLEEKKKQKEQEKMESAKASELLAKIAGLYDKLVGYMEKCNSLEQQLDEAHRMIDELQREKGTK